MKKQFEIILGLFCLLSLYVNSYGQVIKFQNQDPLTFNVIQNVNFGQVIANQGIVKIIKGGTGMGKIEITGQKDLDITVNIPSSVKLYDSSNTYYMNYTIRAAFNNLGSDNYIQSRPFNIPSQTFRIGGRTQGPPAPPPTPNHKGYKPPTGNAWLYLFGNLNVSSVPSGQYSGSITITVVYN